MKMYDASYTNYLKFARKHAGMHVGAHIGVHVGMHMDMPGDWPIDRHLSMGMGMGTDVSMHAGSQAGLDAGSAHFACLKQDDAECEQGGNVSCRIPGDEPEEGRGDVVSLGECIGRPHELEIGNDHVKPFGEGVLFMDDRSSEDVIADGADEEEADANDQGHDLFDACGNSNRQGGKHEHRPENHDDSDQALGVNVGGDGLDFPILADDECHGPGKGQPDAPEHDEGRDERLAVVVVSRSGEYDREKNSTESESGHGSIDMIACGLHDLLSNGEQEHRRERPIGDEQRGGDADEFSENEKRSSHGFADDGEYGVVFDFAVEHAGGCERRKHQADQKQRGQSHVDQEFVVVVHGVGREHGIEHHGKAADENQDHEDGLTNGFNKRVVGDDVKLIEGSHDRRANREMERSRVGWGVNQTNSERNISR